MNALVKYLSWFSEHPGISKEALSDILRLQHSEILPAGNKLPPSYNDALKLVEPFLIQPIIFHACPQDCMIFRKKYKDVMVCPYCGSSRYNKKGIPAKRFLYFPVGPRLVHLFGTANLSQIIQAHGLNSNDSRLQQQVDDIHSSTTWKLAYSNDGQFEGDCQGISFAFNTNGVNPFSHNKVSYSMWPMILTVLNLPRSVCHSLANVWLTGIVPGNGSKEPNNLDPYLIILVDELLAITNKKVFDAYQDAPFTLKVSPFVFT